MEDFSFGFSLISEILIKKRYRTLNYACIDITDATVFAVSSISIGYSDIEDAIYRDSTVVMIIPLGLGRVICFNPAINYLQNVVVGGMSSISVFKWDTL